MSQWDGEMEEKGGPLKNSVLFVLRSLFVLPLDSFIFLAPLSAIGLLVAAERTGAISQRGSYFTDTGHVCPTVRPREAILIGSPPQTQLLSRKCCNKDGREERTVAAAEFKMPTNKRTYDRDRIAPSLVRQMR